jgi:hypothetical protein
LQLKPSLFPILLFRSLAFYNKIGFTLHGASKIFICFVDILCVNKAQRVAHFLISSTTYTNITRRINFTSIFPFCHGSSVLSNETKKTHGNGKLRENFTEIEIPEHEECLPNRNKCWSKPVAPYGVVCAGGRREFPSNPK